MPLFGVRNNAATEMLLSKGFKVHFQWRMLKSNLPSRYTRIQGTNRYASFEAYFKFKHGNVSQNKFFLDFPMALSMTEDTSACTSRPSVGVTRANITAALEKT